MVATDVPNGRPDSTTSPSGAYTHGRVRTPSRSRRPASSSREASSVLARSVTGAGALLKRTHASATSKPYLPSHRAASHAGCDQVMLRYATGVGRTRHGQTGPAPADAAEDRVDGARRSL